MADSPAPWAVYHNGTSIADDFGHLVSTDVEGRTDEEARANATLMAAAPEMLAALEAQEELAALRFQGEPEAAIAKVRELRRAAIAKARAS